MRTELAERPKGLYVVHTIGMLGEEGWGYSRLVSLDGKKSFLKTHRWKRAGREMKYEAKFWNEE